MRVYLPATVAALLDWFEQGRTPSGLTAFAVTAAVREWYVEGDDEEFEWAAQTLAARASLRMLNTGPLERDARRVVLAVDVASPDVLILDADGSAERGSVRLGAPVGVRSWAAVLIDEASTSTVITAAAGAIALADGGDDDAAFAVSEADDVELLWFAVDEIATLRRDRAG